ncbi:hypothetical protein J6E39_04405 [bacterium]|nr:hypothetical protein [bacterium]
MKLFGGARYASVRLKNGATAKLAHGNDYVKYLEMRKGKIEVQRELFGTPAEVDNETAYLLENIVKNAADPVDDTKILYDSCNCILDIMG